MTENTSQVMSARKAAEIYVFSPDDELLTILSEGNGLLEAPFRDELNSVADTPFSFTVDASAIYEHRFDGGDEERNLTQVASAFIGTISGGASSQENVSPAQFIREENRVVFRDRGGRLREFVIKEVDDFDGIDGATTTAVCYPAWIDELNDNYVLDKRYSDKEAQTALDDALAGTRYEGVVEGELGQASTNFYKLTSVECVFKIRETWGGDIADEVELGENGRIAKRKIVLKQRLGADRGLRFEINHNIDEIQRTVLSYPKTALYGWGASLPIEDEEGEETGGHTRYIDFADVEWKKSAGDPTDKPKGQRWVGDSDALESLGRRYDGGLLHRFGEFSDHNIEEPEDLLRATWTHLQESAKHAEVNYRLKVDLIGKEAELGDTAIAIDREFARPIEIQTRIIAVEYDLLDVDGAAVIEMGRFIDLSDDRLGKISEDLERNRGKWDHPTVVDESFPDIQPIKPANIEAIGGFKTIQLYWDYDYSTYISHYEIFGSQGANFSPTEQHLLGRGRVSAFAHEVGTDETWYYYVRAVNTRGTVGEFSDKVSASTVRIKTPDIVFGSVTANLLADLAVTENKIAHKAIQTAHIDNLAVDAFHLKYGIIENVHIADATIEGAKIKDAAIDTAHIADASITSAKIASVSADVIRVGFNSIGEHVKITDEGLYTYENGVATSLLDGEGHHFFQDQKFVGTIGSAGWHDDQNYRGLLFNLGNDLDYMAWAYRFDPSSNPITIFAWHNTSDKTVKGFSMADHLQLVGNLRTYGHIYMEDRNKALYLHKIATYGYEGGNYFLSLENQYYETDFGVSLTRGKQADGSRLHLTMSAAYLVSNDGAYIRVTQDSDGKRIESKDIYDRTYTSTTQMMRVTKNGVLGRSTSSRRYKLLEEVVDLDYAKKILDIDAKSWFDKTACESYASDLHEGISTDKEPVSRIGGVIAEDVHDVGLGMYVNYDDKKRPDGIAHNLWTLLIPISKDHESRIGNIEKEIKEIKEMIA